MSKHQESDKDSTLFLTNRKVLRMMREVITTFPGALRAEFTKAREILRQSRAAKTPTPHEARLD